MNYVRMPNQDVNNMGQLTFLRRLLPQSLPFSLPIVAPSGPIAETQHFQLKQLIDRFNFAYIGHDTAANYSTMLKWYKMIMENFANILTAAQAQALPIKLDAKRRRVAAAPGTFPPIEHAPPTVFPNGGGPVPTPYPFPPVVSIGTWQVPTSTLMYAGGGVAALLLILAMTRKQTPKRR